MSVLLAIYGRWLRPVTLVAWLVILILVACQSTPVPTTPRMPVFLDLNLLSDECVPLRTPGGVLLKTQERLAGDRLGFGGIVLCRSLTEDVFFAYDLACPYENMASTRLTLDGIQLRCPKCKSLFEIVYGSGVPIEGPAKAPLRTYRTSYTPQAYRLVVYN